jgi:TolA-binding protein
MPPRAHSVASGDTFATDATQRQVTLPDGSVLSMGASTRMEVVRVAPDLVRLRLLRGTLTCEVPRVDGRQFVVEAASAEVTVHGTRFTVELVPNAIAQPELSVSVEHGRVQLQVDRQIVAVLESGQKWSSQKARLASPSAPAPEAILQQPDASTPSVEPSAAPSVTAAVRPSARELMDRANAARLAGNSAAAAREYAALRDRYPSDPRAWLAAFELGRIRLNSLGDARGALEAFRFSLAHPGGFFAEDAQAGMVESLNRLGDARACARARDAFLDRYANSAHAARIRLLCPSR